MKIEDFGYICNTIDNGIIILDKDLEVFFWNKWLESRTKITFNKIKNKKIEDFFPNINTIKLKRKIKTSLSLNSPTFYNTEVNRYLLEIPLNNISSKFFDSMQQAITIMPYDKDSDIAVLYIYDNTLLCETNFKLKQVQKDLVNKNTELEESQVELLRSYTTIELLLNTTMEAIFLFEDDSCTHVNKKAIELFSYENEEETKAHAINDLISYTKRDIMEAIIDEPFELEMSKRDKSIFDALVQIKIIQKDGKKIKIITILDISELKTKERLLAQQSKMAAMGEMIENIAHQWRQPLSTISTAASGIKIQKELNILEDKMFYDATDVIVKSTNHLSQTINDFKNFIKGDTNKVLFNLSKNIKTNLSILEGHLRTNYITVIANLDDSIELTNYPNELSQAILNILNNSNDALIDNKIDEKLIFIDTYIKNNEIIIEIKDNALGIEKNIIKKIFEPYFTTKHKHQGKGLGLYMTHQLIDLSMKGILAVQNKKFTYNNTSYLGACFTISFPLIKT